MGNVVKFFEKAVIKVELDKNLKRLKNDERDMNDPVIMNHRHACRWIGNKRCKVLKGRPYRFLKRRSTERMKSSISAAMTNF